MDPQSAVEKNGNEVPVLDQKMHRRKFLMFSGVTASAAAISIVGCKKKDKNDDGVNLGSGDIGVLNYAYALEQLEAAFYTQVMASPYAGITASESAYLTDIRDHEIAHREFFKNALGSNKIQDLEVNFSSIDFTKRDSVLNTAKAFEDLGVAAYNGAGKLITNPAYLLLAGKIVSVEARHAALIRDILSNGSFADLTSLAPLGSNNTNGLDGALMPKDVLAIAGTYIKTKVNANNLPTS